MSDDARQSLADQQRRLIDAMNGNAAPPGFDPTRVAIAGRTLINKRRKAVARSWPAVVKSLGPQFETLFQQYAAVTPLPAEGGGSTDGFSFAEFLDRIKQSTDAIRIEMLSFRIRTRWIALARLTNPNRTAIGLRLPWPVSRCFIFRR